MDVKTESESGVKLLFLVLLLMIIIQFILILILCSRDYMDYLNEGARYDKEVGADTLKIVTPSRWQTDISCPYEDFFDEY